MASAAEQRQALIDLNTLARRDLLALWRQLEGLTAEQTRDALAALLPAIGDTYGTAAAALAADWYDDLREAAGAKGRFLAEPAAPVTQGRWDSLAAWGTNPLFSPTPDSAASLVLVGGGVQRTIADMHRLTVVDNSIADPSASGWKRVGVGGSCGFCRMLIDRGHVYAESSVTFRSHDHCNCAASPEFASNVVRVSTEPFKQSQRTRSDATKAKDNARARAYIADKYGN